MQAGAGHRPSEFQKQTANDESLGAAVTGSLVAGKLITMTVLNNNEFVAGASRTAVGS